MAPRQKPGRSVQTVVTPPELIAAVEHRFGPIDFDLCADAGNTKGKRFYSKEDDALQQDWSALKRVNVAWCNPEFGMLGWFSRRCHTVGDLRRFTLLLCPLGTQNWACEYIWGQAYVMKLRGRVTFVGHTGPFPKDLALVVFGYSLVGEEVWDWRRDAKRAAE
jgi:phage N-6-adenine-methyltransferase